MRITGKWEYEIAPGRADDARGWVADMQQKFIRDGGRLIELFGNAADNGFAFDSSVGGFFNPLTAEITLFYCEQDHLGYRAEELAHYFQYKAQALIGKSESEIGTNAIEQNELAMLGIMQSHGFQRKR